MARHAQPTTPISQLLLTVFHTRRWLSIHRRHVLLLRRGEKFLHRYGQRTPLVPLNTQGFRGHVQWLCRLHEHDRIAQAVYEENQKLKNNVHTSQSALLEQAKRVVAQEVKEAKDRYKAAYESGDADALVQAQEDMTTAKMKAERVNNFKPAPLQEEKTVVQPEYQQAPRVDTKAVEWQKTNKWFGTDKEMTGFALAVHEKLVNDEGMDPQSDEYYRRINGRLRQVFPDKFESAEPADTTQRRKSNVVASATRSVAPKKITLSASEVAIAKRLGLPLERYAREVAILRRNENG